MPLSHFIISPRGFDAIKSRTLLRHFCSIMVFMLLLSALSQVLITVCRGVLLMNISVWDQTCVFTWASCVTASPTALMEKTRGRTAEVMTTNIAWLYIATYNCYIIYLNITSINNISLSVENKALGIKQILVELQISIEMNHRLNSKYSILIDFPVKMSYKINVLNEQNCMRH